MSIQQDVQLDPNFVILTTTKYRNRKITFIKCFNFMTTKVHFIIKSHNSNPNYHISFFVLVWSPIFRISPN